MLATPIWDKTVSRRLYPSPYIVLKFSVLAGNWNRRGTHPMTRPLRHPLTRPLQTGERYSTWVKGSHQSQPSWWPRSSVAISSIWPNLTGQYRGRAEERRTGDWFEFGFGEDSPKGGTGPPKLDTMFWSVYQCGCAGAPDKLTRLLAYQTMLTREARRCGGGCWQAYDAMFRQQAAHSPGTDWSRVNGSLFAVTSLTQQNGKGKSCKYRLESDLAAPECALAPAKTDRL